MIDKDEAVALTCEDLHKGCDGGLGTAASGWKARHAGWEVDDWTRDANSGGRVQLQETKSGEVQGTGKRRGQCCGVLGFVSAEGWGRGSSGPHSGVVEGQ